MAAAAGRRRLSPAAALLAGCVLLLVDMGCTRSLIHKTSLRNYRHIRELAPRMAVRKPLTDRREYTHTAFDSGLRVLAVSDPDAEKSSFAVAVEAGSLEDPPDFQGLAHFCEHMLFLGSAKYPDKEEFSKQLALFGGDHNAYTASEQTVYYNEVGNDGFKRGLDIFAQFFIAPSFDEDMVDKEIHAVDSEHKKNQPDTQRRLWHLLRSKANPENPMHQFSTGDLNTLKTQPEKDGKSLVDALKVFHSASYCARRLHLVLVANRTSEDLLQLAHDSFDEVPTATAENCPPRAKYFDKVAYSKSLGNLGRRYTLTTHGVPEMWVMFPMPPLRDKYKARAEAYLWNALGHFGPGSLKSLLLREDLSQSYSFSSDTSVAGTVVFVTFSLTEKGSRNTEEILRHFFAYFNAVRKAGVNQKLLTEMQQLQQIEFDYQEKTSSEFAFVSSVAGSTTTYPPEDLLTGGFLIDSPDPELIETIIGKISPDNMNVAIVSPTFNDTQATHHEQYYDFGYEDVELDAALVARLREASGDSLAPPPELKYVPHNLELIESSGVDKPVDLLKKGRVEAWWLGLGDLPLPKAIIQLKIGFTPEIISSVEDSILAGMHTRIVQQVLEEPVDSLQMCGLSYSVSTQKDGVGVDFRGFDEHILELIKLVLPMVRRPEYSTSDFEMARRQLVLDLGDVTRSQPYQHALEAFEIVTVKGNYARNELLRTANDAELVNPATHSRFLNNVFESAKLSLLFTGNIDQDRSDSIVREIEALLQITREQASVSHTGALTVVKPKEEVEVRIANPIAQDRNSATLVTYQFGVPTVADRVRLAMLGEIIERPVFETLRTEHQLGYVVFGYVAPHHSIVEVRVLVQGFREDPDSVEHLIEGTVANLTSFISSMEQEEFETRKRSFRDALAKKHQTMAQFAGRFWGQIWDHTYCFAKREMELEYLDSGHLDTPAPLAEAWRSVVAGRPRKVVVKLFGATSAGSPSSSLLTGAEVPGVKTITLVDSVSVGEELHGEEQWPHEFICKVGLQTLQTGPVVRSVKAHHAEEEAPAAPK